MGNPGEYFNLSLAPDGRRVAATFGSDNADIWIVDAVRNVSTRLTFDPASDYAPLWSTDGSRIVYTSDRIPPSGIYLKRSSGAGTDSLLFNPPERAIATDWSHDGRFLVGVVREPKTLWDVWVFPLDGSRKPYPLIAGPAGDVEPSISPDDRWVAYSSTESGRSEIYLQSIDGSGGKLQVSSQGGRDPHWRRDERELYYLAPSGDLMAVDVSATPTMTLGTPHALFRQSIDNVDPAGHYYAVSGDGQRFLVRRDVDLVDAPVTTVYVNWLPRGR